MSGPTNLQDMVEWAPDAEGWATLERGTRAIVHVKSEDGAIVRGEERTLGGERGA